ncbi:MAG: ribonuclease Y [Clostridia bacterium]|nr:ribonuclease Y [Clostridia bacterium]
MTLPAFSSLFLAISGGACAGIAIACAVVCLVVGCIVGYFFNGKQTDKKLGTVSERTKKMIDEASVECKAMKKDALLEVKEQDLQRRAEFDNESKQKRAELSRQENRLNQREDVLNKKEDSLMKQSNVIDQQKKDLQRREKDINATQEKVNKQHELMLAELERVAQLTSDEAKKLLTDQILDETRHETAKQVRQIEQDAKDEADREAKNIIALAIQRCASDQASDITVSVVSLPSDDMKARLIGREGRNIRAIENATGIELIVDDTPEVVIVSGFDPVRREIARLSLERLISDGRIHPAKIEETVEKVKKELDQEIKQAGESAMFEVGIFGLHPEVIKLIGRLKYRTSYGQNVYKHSIEVAQLAGLMAQELGVDVTLAKRMGLLHDIGKAVDFDQEGTHMQIGADLAKKYRENQLVVNAILSHHGDVEPKSIEAVLVAAADAISGARPGARRETGTNYVKRLEKLEEIANSFAGVDKSYAIQAGREIRVIVKPDQIDDAQALFLAKDIAKKIENELEYPGQIKVNVIREFRASEYAK